VLTSNHDHLAKSSSEESYAPKCVLVKRKVGRRLRQLPITKSMS
jgi:hypothetical protein